MEATIDKLKSYILQLIWKYIEFFGFPGIFIFKKDNLRNEQGQKTNISLEKRQNQEVPKKNLFQVHR